MATFLSRPKLHYKPLNLIFSLHSHEAEAFRETVTQVAKSSGQLSSSLPTRILPTRFRLVPLSHAPCKLLLRRLAFFSNLAKSRGISRCDPWSRKKEKKEREKEGKAVKGEEFQGNSNVLRCLLNEREVVSPVRCADTRKKLCFDWRGVAAGHTWNFHSLGWKLRCFNPDVAYIETGQRVEAGTTRIFPAEGAKGGPAPVNEFGCSDEILCFVARSFVPRITPLTLLYRVERKVYSWLP